MDKKPTKDLEPTVTLCEITADTVRQVTDLGVFEHQQHFVASNAVSLAEALFNEEAWFRAIYYGELLVGFVMLYDETLRNIPPVNPEVFLWRFMIDARFQGKGIGKAALSLVISHLKAKGVFSSISTSYVSGSSSPEGFYLNQGFHHTGKLLDGEIVLERSL